MTKEGKGAWLLAFFAIGAVCSVFAMVEIYEADKANKDVASEPRVVKIKEVVGTVVGGPQIVTGNPLIGYAVYVEELRGMVALSAEKCPPLANGQKVAMFQKDALGLSEWYTFIRYEYLEGG